MAGSGTNIVIITGNLTKDPVLPYKDDDKENARWLGNSEDRKPCRISIAVDRPVAKGKDAVTDYFDVALFGALARTAATYLKKGRLVLVEGALRLSTWEVTGFELVDGKETQTTSRRQKIEIVARSFSMLDKKPAAPQEEVPDEAYND